MTRPGNRLRMFAAHVLDAWTMEHIVDPAIADLQRDPTARSYGAVLKVLLLCVSQEALMLRPERTSGDRRAVARLLGATVFLTALGTLLLEAPFLSDAWNPVGFDSRVLLYLAPQAFPLALAVGVTLATVFAIEGRALSSLATAWLVTIGLVASVISLIDLAWITPAANQAFRVAVSGDRDLVRGAAEMTLRELWRVAPSDAALAFHFHARCALAVSPLMLVAFAWSTVKATARTWVAGCAAVGALVAYDMLLYGGQRLTLVGHLPAFAAAWLPNVVLMMIAVALMIVPRTLRACRRPAAS